MTKKRLIINDKFYGYLGEDAQCKGLKVGDLVCIMQNKDRFTNWVGFVVKEDSYYSVFGCCMKSLEKIVSKIGSIIKILDYSLVTPEILINAFGDPDLNIKFQEIRKMTLEEIEKE